MNWIGLLASTAVIVFSVGAAWGSLKADLRATRELFKVSQADLERRVGRIEKSLDRQVWWRESEGRS